MNKETIEGLLKPRIKCIAADTSGDWEVGTIIEFSNIYPYSGFTYIHKDKALAPEYFYQFPHLFKRLEWWHERKIDELPKYLKSVLLPHHYVIVDRPYMSFFEGGKDGEYFEAPYHEYIPCTEEEYLTFIQSK